MRKLRAAQADIVDATECLQARTKHRDAIVVELLKMGWSERDVARIAGLSHVRVHQIREASR